jgi:4-amino-4-deoxy-L-arabinose transferase-like glycosyltransferase
MSSQQFWGELQRWFYRPATIWPLLAITAAIVFACLFIKAQNRSMPEKKDRWRLKFFPLTRGKMERTDWFLMAALTLVYALTAFYRPGNCTAPQTYWQFARIYDAVEIRFAREVHLDTVVYFNAFGNPGQDHTYSLRLSPNGTNWELESISMPAGHAQVFTWQKVQVGATARSLRINAQTGGMRLGELGFYERIGDDLVRVPVTDFEVFPPEAKAALFDEQDILRSVYTYENSMYFDEIYHARTAYEYIHGLRVYETTHPPLGKVIISWGIRLFGMTPFGWRIMGILFGVLMTPLLYILAKWILKHTAAAMAAAVVFTFDFMHLTQTRIATIDTYAVFFILLMYLFMWGYITCPLDAPLKKTLPWLALSGLSFGLGAASKWVCIYAGLGLAVLYALYLIARWQYYRERVLPGRDKKVTPAIPGYRGFLIGTLAFSVLFFIVVPATVYLLSYIPYMRGMFSGQELPIFGLRNWFGDGWIQFEEWFNHETGSLDVRMVYETRFAFWSQHTWVGRVWQNQAGMLIYHGADVLGNEHPFSSTWVMWLFNARPILYYLEFPDIGWRSAFASFNNPLVSWAGLLAMGVLAVRFFKRRCGMSMFILIGYLSQLLPWVFITRLTFAYHYFPSIVFLALGIGVACREIWDETPKHRWAVPAFAGACVLLYFVFFPYLMGMPMTDWYSNHILAWFPSWPWL